MEDIRREEVEWEGKLEQGRRLAKTGPVTLSLLINTVIKDRANTVIL